MADPNYRPEVKAVIDGMVLGMPGVKGGQAFGYPAYKANGKVFLFVGGFGIAVKLPLARVAQLTAADPNLHAFEPAEGKVWKEWVSIDLPDPEGYHAYAALFEESVSFVLG